MNFNLIYDAKQIKKIEDFLSPLEKDELYMLFLFARKKYGTNVKDMNVLSRQLVLQNDNILKKLYRFNVPKESFTDKDGSYFKNENLACYCTFNPRDIFKSIYRTGITCNQAIYDSLSEKKFKNPVAISWRELQMSNKRKVFIDLDFDFKDKEYCLDLIEEKGILEWFLENMLIETRGGFHLLCKLSSIQNKKWFKDIEMINKSIENDIIEINSKSQDLMPVPGTLQGGFEVKIREESKLIR